MRVQRIFIYAALAFALAIAASCGQTESSEGSLSKTRGIYHWKTTFSLTQEDTRFLKEHNIGQLYVRMFDVGPEDPWDDASREDIVPLGTTRFISPVPVGCKVIPTVYITQKALRAYAGCETELADLIVDRVYAMASWNDLGQIEELQYDCDWTKETKGMFERLCEHTRKRLKENGAVLSGTVRLHQIEEAYYPFDKGVVMIYNTGSLYDVKSVNSILNYDDVHKYLSVQSRIDKFLDARKENCTVMEMAYPTFGWGVVYSWRGDFKRIVSSPDEYETSYNEQVRWETSEFDQIMRVKSLVDNTIGRASQGNVIYHLDTRNLNKYAGDEIEDIYQ